MSGSARANERWGRSLSGQGGFCSFRKGAGLNQSVATGNIKWMFESQKASEQQTQTANTNTSDHMDQLTDKGFNLA